MAIMAYYVFKNNLRGDPTVIIVKMDNFPTSAGEKIKEALIQYGSQDFDPDELAEVFAEVNSYSGCDIIEDSKILDRIDEDDGFFYVVEATAPEGSKKANIHITVHKNKRQIFKGPMKKFFTKAIRLEKTYMGNLL